MPRLCPHCNLPVRPVFTQGNGGDGDPITIDSNGEPPRKKPYAVAGGGGPSSAGAGGGAGARTNFVDLTGDDDREGGSNGGRKSGSGGGGAGAREKSGPSGAGAGRSGGGGANDGQRERILTFDFNGTKFTLDDKDRTNIASVMGFQTGLTRLPMQTSATFFVRRIREIENRKDQIYRRKFKDEDLQEILAAGYFICHPRKSSVFITTPKDIQNSVMDSNERSLVSNAVKDKYDGMQIVSKEKIEKEIEAEMSNPRDVKRREIQRSSVHMEDLKEVFRVVQSQYREFKSPLQPDD